MRVAAIGIGSNSVRMLLAEAVKGYLTRISRDREGTRLFAGLDENRNLSRESMEKTAAAVTRMVESAKNAGAEQIRIFATSASRDAANGETFIDLIRSMTGLDLDIISGEEEAVLSFMGATEGHDGLCGVVDIGGGSTEVVLGDRDHILRSFSCQMGAVRLFSKLPITSEADLPPVRKLAKEILLETMEGKPLEKQADHWIGTGGTFTALAALSKGIHWTDRTNMHGTVLTREQIEALAVKLSNMTLEQRLKLDGLQPGRADIVVHGICILQALMEEFVMNEITVSELGNLDGFVRREYC